MSAIPWWFDEYLKLLSGKKLLAKIYLVKIIDIFPKQISLRWYSQILADNNFIEIKKIHLLKSCTFKSLWIKF